MFKRKQHHCGLVGLLRPRGQAARSKAAPGAPRSGAELQEQSDEASGLERGARAGRTPRVRSRGALTPIERTRTKGQPFAMASGKTEEGGKEGAPS